MLRGDRPVGPPRARRRRLPPPAVRGRRPTRAPRTARCSPPCGARARSRASAPGERLATMASLLHVDREGASLAAALIARSGLDAGGRGCAATCDAYLTPLLHCFYAYDLVFMPHGENVILVLDEDGVVRAGDLQGHRRGDRGDEPGRRAAAGGRADPRRGARGHEAPVHLHRRLRLLPALPRRDPRRRRASWTRTTSGDGRRLRPRLPDSRRRTWPTGSSATTCSRDEFALSCLNRLQLRNNQQMVDLPDPAGALQLVGTLENPLARFAP